MSARAIRKLRQEREAQKMAEIEEDEEEFDEPANRGPKPAFLAMMDDSSSEDDDDDDDDDDHEEEEDEREMNEGAGGEGNEALSGETAQTVSEKANQDSSTTATDNEGVQEKEEDLDTLLAEFESKDQSISLGDTKQPASSTYFKVLVKGMDPRDLDVDFVVRTNLMGDASEASQTTTPPRRNRQSFVFGPQQDGWMRPPHYVGGGIGMTTYDRDPNSIPWPYTEAEIEGGSLDPDCANPKRWYTFMQSDTYKKDVQDYRHIQDSGDANALAMFVAHHPFVTEALLQLANLCYLTNQSQEGLSLIKRTLWIFECAALTSFEPHGRQQCFVDFNKHANENFFNAMFRLMQVSSIAGWMRTSLAIARYMLSLDPLRDPLGVLAVMDFYALSTMQIDHARFVVDLVESDRIHLFSRDEDGTHRKGPLLEMPNWAYSYSLALHRLAQEGLGCSEKANSSLVSAVRKFPSIVEQLLEKNEVDTKNRSIRKDWPSIVSKLRARCLPPGKDHDFDPVVYHATKSVVELIAKVFVQRNYKLWSSNNVELFLYDACAEVCGQDESTPLPSSALLRYARLDPSDYEDRHRRLPPEANPLNPGILAPAMAVDPNRRRLLRRGDRGDQAAAEDANNLFAMAAANADGINLGGPPTQVIDPDSPMMQIFLESLLPWAQVEGIPPPRW